MITQRVIVPGGTDRVTSPPISRTAFDRMQGSAKISLGQGEYVLRAECFWDDRQQTISLLAEFASVLDLASQDELDDEEVD